MEQNNKEGSYEEEKRSSFWLNNINTGDIYRSFIKGIILGQNLLDSHNYYKILEGLFNIIKMQKIHLWIPIM